MMENKLVSNEEILVSNMLEIQAIIRILKLMIKPMMINEYWQNNYSMELLTQPINRNGHEAETIFSRQSRENYFAMMEVAHRNLSIVDEKDKENAAVLKKTA